MINDDLKAFFDKEPQFQTARELANILLRHFSQVEEDKHIDAFLEMANTKWFECPEHGQRVGYFYLCDLCSASIQDRERGV